MSKRFHTVIALFAFLFGIVCLMWGLVTTFAVIRTPPPPDGTIYFEPPSLMEILGVDGIEVHWSRLALAAIGGTVILVLFRILKKQEHESAS